MVNKSDCKLGFGYNANLLISDIFKKAPEYLAIAYDSSEISEDVKRVIEEYIEIPVKQTKIVPEHIQCEAKEPEPMTDTQVDELIHQQEVQAQEPEIKEEITDKPKEKKKMVKKQPPTEETVELKPTCLLAKINAIRQAWSKTETEKDGKGKAGGGAKYDYYKPQQIIDFCLAQELEHDLFSEFKINEGICSYILTDIPSGQTRSVECPFEIPRKMAASEAQQVGAAMTYHNRRLAMMMYKIEDNSKENVNVLEDADFSAQNMPAPVIPAAPIITPPPANVAPPIAEQIVSPEPTSEPVVEVKVEEPKVVAPTPEIIIPPAPVAGIDEQTGTPEAVAPLAGDVPPPSSKLMNGQTPYIDPSSLMSGKVKKGVVVEETDSSIPPTTPPKIQTAPPPPPVTPVVETPAPAQKASKGNIEALYE